MSSDNPTGADNQQETSGQSAPLDPMWVVGFVDGEGCFSVSVHRNPLVRRTRGWQLQAAFQVYQHQRHHAVLEAVMAHLGCGAIRSKGPRSSVLTYTVWNLTDLRTSVIPGFDRIVRLAYAMNHDGKQRARTLEDVLEGSSETARQAFEGVGSRTKI